MREVEFADWFPIDDEPEPAYEPALYDPDYDYTREPDVEPEDVPGTITMPAHDQELESLRNYQNRAVVNTFGHWKAGVKSCLIVHPTGSGKTHTGSALIARYQHHFGPRSDGSNRRALVLDHRDYLLDQWARTLVGMGVDSAIEKGRKKARAALWGDPDVVIASVQSMQANEVTQRLRSWEPDYFDLVLVDECFPAGTLVDGRPIESINPGDVTLSVNHGSGKIEGRPVVRTFRRKPSGMIRIHLNNGDTLACTPDHPVFVQRGNDHPRYIAAIKLRLGDGMYCRDGTAETESGEVPDALQDRHCKSNIESRDRSGRAFSWGVRPKDSRPEERSLFAVARVDRIEVLEPGCDETFGGLCPDGFVYNLEVEGNNNYFAGGYLVHNCHHVLSPSYRKILNHFDWQHLLGLTATPARHDGRKLGEVFDVVSDEYMLDEAIEDGWVCGIEVAWCDVKLDISDVKTVGRGKSKDLNEADLTEKIRPYVEKFARAIKRVVGDRQIIVFAPSVFISEKMSDALTSIGIRSEHLDAKSRNRDVVLNAYRNKEYQCLCNYGLFTEGFDVPGIGAVVLLRPTEVWGLYYQMIGRGLRPNDGENLLVVDFPWVSGEHKLVRPADIFGGGASRYSEETIREAEKLLDVGAVDDLLEAVKQADREVYERNRYRLEIEDGPVKFRKTTYNPLNTSDRDALPKRKEAEERRVVAATFKQVAILQYNGIAGAESMSKRRASAIISTIKRREAAGKAPYPQVKRLVELGIPRAEAREMKATDATKIIEGARHYGPSLGLFGRELF